jgi:Nif-specific regulatory protein
VIEIVLPPLRERKEDITLLIEYFLKENGIRDDDNPGLVDYPELIERIKEYDWPGNVRELKNEIDKIAFSVINNEKFTLQLLSEKIINLRNCEGSENSSSLYGELGEIEKKKIIKALKKNGWVKSKAAKALNLPVTTLKNKIKKYGIEHPF